MDKTTSREEIPMLTKSGETETKSGEDGSKEEGEGGTTLKRELGLLDGASIIVGTIVGSGIFVSPKGVLQNVGSVGSALIVWCLTGLLSMIGAVCYAELGTMIPKSGGDYAYIEEGFGSLPGFLYLWCSMLVMIPTTNAVKALTFANYVLQPFYPECDAPDNAVRIIAALVITVLTAINCQAVKWAVKVQDFFTIAKIFALILIIIAGGVHLAMGNTSVFDAPMENSKTDPGHIALAFYSGIYSYGGWNYLNFITEELKEPNKNLPRAIFVSMPMVTVIYVLTNVAYFAVLSPTELLASNAVAVSFADHMFGVMRWVMPLLVACSTFGAINGSIFASSRLFFVGSRNGHMPRVMSFINVNNCTPVPCLLILCVITLAMLTTSDVYVLINFTSFVESIFITGSIACILYLRWKQPDRERPIKVNIALPIIFFLVCGFLVCLPIYVQPKTVAVGLGIIASGIPVYFIFIHWRPACIRGISGTFDRSVQKLCLAVPEEPHQD